MSGAAEAGHDGARRHLVLAPMRTRDLRAVLAIEREVFPKPWSHRLFVEELAQRSSRVYRTAWAGRALAGFAGLMLVDEDAHVNTIAVEPQVQGAGVGTVLLLDLARTAVARGARHLTLEVRVGNEAAIALYHRFGLAPVGVRANYYPETGDDALVMWVRNIEREEYAHRLATIEAGLPADLEVTW